MNAEIIAKALGGRKAGSGWTALPRARRSHAEPLDLRRG